MGEFANAGWLNVVATVVAGVIVVLNGKLVVEQIQEWIAASSQPALIYLTAVPTAVALGCLLLYITLKPFIHLPPRETIPAWRKLTHFVRAKEDSLDLDVPRYRRLGVAVAFNDDDRKVLSHALPLARQHDAALCLFHVVEGAGSTVFGPEAYDTEAREDEEYLNRLATALGHKGVEVEVFLGFGDVPGELVRLALEQTIDVLVMGGHGHRGISDLLFGSTISPVRHELDIPIIIVR
jgi:manganese transport protein